MLFRHKVRDKREKYVRVAILLDLRRLYHLHEKQKNIVFFHFFIYTWLIESPIKMNDYESRSIIHTRSNESETDEHDYILDSFYFFQINDERLRTCSASFVLNMYILVHVKISTNSKEMVSR